MTQSRSLLLFVLTLLLAARGYAQQLPPGTALPVMSNSSLNFAKTKPGDRITARLMQDVVLPSGEKISAGAKIEGQVVEAAQSSSSSPARMVIRFDHLISGDKQFPVTLSLRSLASMQDVFNAQLPVGTFDDFGTSISDWTTVQVGGAVVYLGDRTVRDGMQIVGKAPGYGITRAKLVAAPKRGCPADSELAQREQSLWVFSPWACGTYGFDDLTIAPGTTAGTVELTSPKDVNVRAGSGWLLVSMPTVGTGNATASSAVSCVRLTNL